MDGSLETSNSILVLFCLHARLSQQDQHVRGWTNTCCSCKNIYCLKREKNSKNNQDSSHVSRKILHQLSIKLEPGLSY